MVRLPPLDGCLSFASLFQGIFGVVFWLQVLSTNGAQRLLKARRETSWSGSYCFSVAPKGSSPLVYSVFESLYSVNVGALTVPPRHSQLRVQYRHKLDGKPPLLRRPLPSNHAPGTKRPRVLSAYDDVIRFDIQVPILGLFMPVTHAKAICRPGSLNQNRHSAIACLGSCEPGILHVRIRARTFSS